jgi:hypothetical protein
LISDIGERPRSWARTADVARGGIVARLAAAGLCGCALEAREQVRDSLVWLACCVAIFLGFGAAIWSQLTIGGIAACAVMVVFLAGCCSWLVAGGPGPRNLFQAGAIDVAGVAVMTIALAVARQAAHQARRGGLRLVAQ